MPQLYVLVYAHDESEVAQRWQQVPPADHVDAAVESFRMLADGTRLRILWLLCGGEYDVGALTEQIGAARPAVSQHLAKLRLAGLVTTRRDGRRALYRARGGHVRRLLGEALEAAGHVVEGLPDHE